MNTKTKKLICEDCNGLGYHVIAMSIGLCDSNDSYNYPHIEKCDTCKVFNSDEQAKDSIYINKLTRRYYE
jgi:hypothetical protein